MTSVAIVCAGPSVLDTWPGKSAEHDVVVAVNTAADYVDDARLDWWSVGDLVTMDDEPRRAVLARWPRVPNCGILVNSGCDIPDCMAHLMAYDINAFWPLTYRNRTLSMPCVAFWASQVLRPASITLYGVDLSGGNYADGRGVWNVSDARWILESAALCTAMDESPEIRWASASGNLEHIRQTASMFRQDMSAW